MHYPSGLNPFGDSSDDEYPEQLNPFDENEEENDDDYDPSLNPFAPESDSERKDPAKSKIIGDRTSDKNFRGHRRDNEDNRSKNNVKSDEHESSDGKQLDAINPFAEDLDEDDDDDNANKVEKNSHEGDEEQLVIDLKRHNLNVCVEHLHETNLAWPSPLSRSSLNSPVPGPKINDTVGSHDERQVQISHKSLEPSENSKPYRAPPSPTPSKNSNHESQSLSLRSQSQSNSLSINYHLNQANSLSQSSTSSMDEFRPVPLPRKKSSLRKSGTLHHTKNLHRAVHSTSSLPRVTPDNLDNSVEGQVQPGNDKFNDDQHLQPTASLDKNERTATDNKSLNCDDNNINGHSKSLDRRSTSSHHKKRAAPPLPVNFKRQVDGCLTEIENEIEDIGVKLLDIEQESLECRQKIQEKKKKKIKRLILKKDSPSEDEATKRLAVLFKQKSQLARRHKELMYKKREHILDLHYSDIEYQLRMITNKQVHLRTNEDDAREQELLKKLVEIVEEKNDIFENQNKDCSTI